MKKYLNFQTLVLALISSMILMNLLLVWWCCTLPKLEFFCEYEGEKYFNFLRKKSYKVYACSGSLIKVHDKGVPGRFLLLRLNFIGRGTLTVTQICIIVFFNIKNRHNS